MTVRPRTSRPKSSVPLTCCKLGGWIASAGWDTLGSVGTSSGAQSAAKMSSPMNVPPIRNRGWRRMLRQLKTRRGFGAAASAVAARAVGGRR